jgi:hypothetical protein
VKAPGERRTRGKRRKGAEPTREGPSEVARRHESPIRLVAVAQIPEIFVFFP